MPFLGSRRLGDGGLLSPSPLRSPPPPLENVDYDFALILASLLCVVIGVLGLVAFARSSWIRSIAGASSEPASSSSSNRGLKKKVLEALPKNTFGDDKEQAEKLSECAICLSEFTAGDQIRVLPLCGHGFHVVCVDTWLGVHSSCPSCRRNPVPAAYHKCVQLPPVACPGGASTPPERTHNFETFLP